ncbi:gliding motility-associated C-terminal domain-containing protein, partial [Salibacteraceae bacterium]|nr:gliding motility-associated C-terminal domain-containing protein [Salibacteraceae bacterium]
LAQGGIEYDWIPQTGLNNSTIADPVFTAKEESIFTVTGTDEKGCSNTATQTILTNNDFNVIPTNVITPDGNGQNDFWVIQNIENYQDGKIAVYDRWGGEVLNTTEYQNDWDGRNAKGDILPDGAYYYTISFPDSERTYKGALTILRNNK